MTALEKKIDDLRRASEENLKLADDTIAKMDETKKKIADDRDLREQAKIDGVGR